MKTKTLVSILVLFLAVIVSSCATAPEIKEDKEVIVTETFLQAVKSGDIAEVKRLIGKGADVNAQDNEGFTAINTATYHEYVEIVRILIEAGADVNSQAMDGFTPLYVATYNGYVEIVNMLTKAGADVNVQYNEGWTALMISSFYGHQELTRLLIEAGADVDAQNNEGWTALMQASHEGHPEVTLLLIEAGADVNVQDKEGMSALMFATIHNQEEIVLKLIRSGVDINRQSNSGATALNFAVGLEYTRIVEFLNEAASQLQKDAAMSEERLYEKITREVTFLSGPHPQVLPEGKSVFYGEYTCAQGLAGSVTIMHRSGGDLTVVNLHGSPITVRNIQPVGHYRAVGTYNPKSNLYTEVPDTWLSPPTPGWIMVGRSGIYDGKTGRLSGTVPIGATWADGSPLCTTFKHSRIARSHEMDILEREPFKTPITLTGSPIALPNGTSQWSGTFTLNGIRAALTLELQHTEGGRVVGLFSYLKSGKDGTEVSFLMTGTHNPDTGRFSLGPNGWETDTQTGRQMFFVDGHHLRDPNRLSIRIITGSGNSSDEEIVVLNPLEFFADSSASASDIELFLQAVVRGDTAEVKRLIEEGADVNAQSVGVIHTRNSGGIRRYKRHYDTITVTEGDTALSLALRGEHTEIVELLKEEGAKEY